MSKLKVSLFKPSGRYYTEEEWEIPLNAFGPYDMRFSRDYRTIDKGPVLISEESPWGYPYIIFHVDRHL